MSAKSGHGLVSSDLNRRDFLRRTAIGLTGVVTGPLARAADLPEKLSSPTAPHSLVGSNVYGWGQYAQRDHKSLVIEDVISALRDTGYDYLEANLDVSRPDENGHFAEQLKAKGLRPVSLYAGARLHEADKAAEVVSRIVTAAKVCSQAGFQVLSCNADPIGREKTDQELNTQAAALTELGEGLNDVGMRLGVHQHMPEMANNAREFRYTFGHSKPEVVGWCYDVHWVWKGGVLPLDALRQYGDRVVTWHLRQSRNGVWWEQLDTGDIDYASVAQYAREHGLARRFSVELALEPGTKITRSVIENHRLSREFVRRVFGA
jgi:inosose dehydratase